MTKDTKSLARYLAGAFGISWIMEAILIILDKVGVLSNLEVLNCVIMSIAVFGPGIGAYAAWKSSGEIKGLRDYFKKEFAGTFKISCVVLIFSMIVMSLAHYLTVARSEEKWFMFLFYIPFMMFGGGFEELGWRGFLHPFFSKKFGFALSILFVGVIWAVWHLPLWLISSTDQASSNFFSFLLLCLCLSLVLAVVREITQNTLVCILLHAWFNVLFAMFKNTITEFSIKANLRFVILAVIAASIYIIWKRSTIYGKNHNKAQ